MNKIFKVIFNKAKGIFVVTGENAKAQGKSKHLKAIAASVMLISVSGIIENVEAKDYSIGRIENTAFAETIPFNDKDYRDITLKTSGALIRNETEGSELIIQGAKNNAVFTGAGVIDDGNVNSTISIKNFENLTLKTMGTSNAPIYLRNGKNITVNIGEINNALSSLTFEQPKNTAIFVNSGASTVNIFSDIVNIGSDEQKVVRGIYSNGNGHVNINTNKFSIRSTNVGIYGSGYTEIHSRNNGTGQIDIKTEEIGVFAGHVTLDADSVSIVTAYNEGQQALNRNQAISLIGNDVLTITADNVVLGTEKADGTYDNNTQTVSASNGSKITIDSKNLNIEGGIGYSAYSGNRGEKAQITLKSTDGNMVLKGEIATTNNQGGDSAVDVNIFANNSQIKTEKNIESSVTSNSSSVMVSLDNSNWNIGGADNNIKSLTADKATINLGSNKAAINDYTSGSKGATITMDGSKSEQLTLNNSSGSGTTLIETNGTTENQLVLKNNTVDIRLKLSKAASDRIGDQLQTVADMVDLSENTGDNAKGITAALAEGDIIGARTLQLNAAGQITQVSEQKNRVMESLKDIGINNFLSFRAQMNDLDKRMGDLRTMPNTDGAWARLIAGQSQYQSNHNTYKTLQVGVDHRIGSFVLGGMASYTDGNGTLKQGSTDDTLYSFGLYGAWMNDDGQFVDVTLKRHHVASDYDLHYLGGQKAKGSFDTSGTSLSAEYGWRLGITNTNYYIEPQVELMYGHLNRFNYKTSNGVKIEQDAMKTLVGRFGLAAGWVSPDKAGSAYAKISVLNDWEGDADSKAKKDNTSRRYHEDMGGTWVEYALGGTYNLTKHLSAYGELETTSGSPTRTTYQVSAGLRWSF